MAGDRQGRAGTGWDSPSFFNFDETLATVNDRVGEQSAIAPRDAIVKPNVRT